MYEKKEYKKIVYEIENPPLFLEVIMFMKEVNLWLSSENALNTLSNNDVDSILNDLNEMNKELQKLEQNVSRKTNKR